MWVYFSSLIICVLILIWVIVIFIRAGYTAFHTDEEIADADLSIVEDKTRDGIIVGYRYFISNEEVDLAGRPMKPKTVTDPNILKPKSIILKTNFK